LKIPKFVNELYCETDITEMFRGSLIHVQMLLNISTALCPISIYVYIVIGTSDNV